jgi:hypothetical protein
MLCLRSCIGLFSLPGRAAQADSHHKKTFGSTRNAVPKSRTKGIGIATGVIRGAIGIALAMSDRCWPSHAASTPPIDRSPTATAAPKPFAMSTDRSA